MPIDSSRAATLDASRRDARRGSTRVGFHTTQEEHADKTGDR